MKGVKGLVLIGLILIMVSVGCITPKGEDEGKNDRGGAPETFEKFDLSFSAPPEFNKPVELTLDVVYVYNRENITIYIDLPDGFELVSGDLKWEGNYVKNTPVQLKAVVKPVKTGEWMIRGFFNFDSEIGPAKILDVTISEDSVEVSSGIPSGPGGELKRIY